MSELRDRIAEALLAEFHHEYVAYHVDAVIDCFLPVVQEALDEKDAAIEKLRQNITYNAEQYTRRENELRPFNLDNYERDNLLALLFAVAGYECPASPLNAANTGDWVLQIAWKLGNTSARGNPNQTSEEMAENARQRATWSSALITAKRDAALAVIEKVRALHVAVMGNGWTWCAEDQTRYPCATVHALPTVDPAGGGEQ